MAGVRGRRWWRRQLLWHGGPPAARPTRRRPPADAELAAAAGVDPTRLIVDFRDDVSAETLANNGFNEIPISDYSATDRLYRIDFANAAEAAAARAKLAHDPSVESVDFESLAAIPPGEDAQKSWPLAAGEESMEAECRRRPPAASFPNDACFKYQWHLRQLGMPDAWKRGNGKGVIVAVIDTGVTQGRAIWPRPSSSPATTSSSTTPTPTTTTATARTSPGPSRSRPTTSSASPASPTAPPSCRSRC